MKIKDIVIREDGVTVAAVSGDKAKLSTGQEIDAKTLTPDPQHPGQFKMPAMDPNAIKPGAVVSSDATTSEDYEEEGHHDTVASGNHPVGGDSSDDFINSVRDKDYERAQRSHSMLRIRGGAGQKTNIGFDPNNPGGPGAANGSFGESADDRLLKQMLSIAGLR
jgi:hypothetical protein